MHYYACKLISVICSLAFSKVNISIVAAVFAVPVVYLFFQLLVTSVSVSSYCLFVLN